MSSEDSEEHYNKIAHFEKAIAEKYGKAAIRHPSSNWNTEKEKNYLAQLKNLANKDIEKEEVNKVKFKGFLVSEKLIRDSSRVCLICDIYSFDRKDDLYMNKFGCCYDCYLDKVQNREESWQEQRKQILYYKAIEKRDKRKKENDENNKKTI